MNSHIQKNKITVIIPVYNIEEYLEECLDSILSQTLKDIEIVCIDDESSDKSLKILRKYENKIKNLKVLVQKNSGAAVARNLGLQHATGEFVAFMDADDFYPTNDVLETLYNEAKKNNVKICGGELLRFDNKTKTINKDFEKEYASGFSFKKNRFIEYSKYQFCYGFTRFIYDRKFLVENNIFFPNYKRFEDPPFLVNAMTSAKRFYAIKKPVYLYRCDYKTYKWSIEAAKDFLRAIDDIFIIADKYNFKKLRKYNYTKLKQVSKVLNHSMRKKDFELFSQFFQKKRFKEYKIIKKYFLHDWMSCEEFYNIIGSKKCLLWGASIYLQDILNEEKNKNPNIIGIIDKNPDLWDKKYGNYNIYSPKEINNLGADYIIMTVYSNHEEIYPQIKKYIKENYKNITLLSDIF